MPGSYAMHAYDAALLIDAALKATGGKTDDKDARARRHQEGGVQVAARRLQVRHQRLPDPGLLSGEGRQAADGKFQTEIVEKVFDDYTDAYAKECAATN